MAKTTKKTTKKVSKKTSRKVGKIKKGVDVVDKKFLTKLAKDIYDPEDKTYLRLCKGTLQNGPDPEDGKRTMHCGLGELYFAVTGRQPEDDDISEEQVVDLVIKKAGFESSRKVFDKVSEAISKLKFSDVVKDLLLDRLNDATTDELMDWEESQFQECLDSIPDANDSDGSRGNQLQDDESYRARAQRVSEKLLDAAKLLPQ